MKFLRTAAIAAIIASGAQFAQADTGITYAETSLGMILVDANGMTLYTFDKDVDGVSACYDDCAVKWPIVYAPADAVAEGDFGLTTRTDGTLQWTYDGMPLYLWFKDAAPGDVTGDGVGGVWHVIHQE